MQELVHPPHTGVEVDHGVVHHLQSIKVQVIHLRLHNNISIHATVVAHSNRRMIVMAIPTKDTLRCMSHLVEDVTTIPTTVGPRVGMEAMVDHQFTINATRLIFLKYQVIHNIAVVE